MSGASVKGKVSGHCIRCGAWRKSLHHDHIIPRAAGGTDDVTNIQLLCANCHQDKSEEDKLNPAFELTRAKLRAAKLGKKLSAEHRLKQSQAHLRRYNSDPEARKKISDSLLGHAVTEETKKKISDTRIRLGIKHSEETRKKISEALVARHANKPTSVN